MGVDMTEGEAKGRHCPFGRIREGGATTTAAVNRSPDGTSKGGSLCLAAKCMGWVWLDVNKKDGDCRAFTQNQGN